MDIKELDFNLAKTLYRYSDEVKNLIQESQADENTRNIVYDVSAETKHVLDSFRVEIVNYLKDNS